MNFNEDATILSMAIVFTNCNLAIPATTANLLFDFLSSSANPEESLAVLIPSSLVFDFFSSFTTSFEKSAIILSYLFPLGSDALGLPTYKPKKAAPAPTMVDMNAAWALLGSDSAINQVVDA
jgi:hypothetical protein